MAGRHTAEDSKNKKKTRLVEAVILRSPTRQVQAANEEAEGGRADERLEVSEKSAVCLQKCPSSLYIFQICNKYIQREEEARKRMEKDESKSTGRVNRQREQGGGTGALLE